MNEWDEAEVVSSASLTQDQKELIERELLLLQKEHEIPTVEVLGCLLRCSIQLRVDTLVNIGVCSSL